MANDMLDHLFHAVPDFNRLPQPADKEQRLKVIIANLERQQQEVRASMIAEARQTLDRLKSDTDIDMDGNASAPSHPDFAANMNAQYTGSGDPFLLPGTISTADQPVKQAPVTPEVTVAQSLTERMEAYDKHARQRRDYYVKALERQRGSRSEADVAVASSKAQTEAARDPRRRPTG